MERARFGAFAMPTARRPCKHASRVKSWAAVYLKWYLNEIDKLLGDLSGDPLLRLDGGRAQVRRADHARVPHETPRDAALHGRLANEHVERRSLAFARRQGVEQRLLVHYSAASHVDDTDARLAPLERFHSN